MMTAKKAAKRPKMSAVKSGDILEYEIGEVFVEIGDFLFCFSEARTILFEDMSRGSFGEVRISQTFGEILEKLFGRLLFFGEPRALFFDINKATEMDIERGIATLDAGGLGRLGRIGCDDHFFDTSQAFDQGHKGFPRRFLADDGEPGFDGWVDVVDGPDVSNFLDEFDDALESGINRDFLGDWPRRDHEQTLFVGIERLI